MNLEGETVEAELIHEGQDENCRCEVCECVQKHIRLTALVH